MYKKRASEYIDHIIGVDKETLNEIWQGLELKITDPIDKNDHNLYMLDLSSGMVTGTFKDLIAGYIIAYCKYHDIKEFVTQSSGNTANSIGYYASKYKIKVTILYPKRSRYKIMANTFDPNRVTLIETDMSEQEQKDLTQQVSDNYNMPRLPRLPQQIEGNIIRSYFINDFIIDTNTTIQTTSQGLSSGFGVFSLYDGLRSINPTYPLPSFLGVQQTAINPYYRILYNKDPISDEVIEPTLFRSKPSPELYARMINIVKSTNGQIRSIDSSMFKKYEEKATKLLLNKNITTTKVEDQTIEKAGLFSLIGVLDAIDQQELVIGNTLVSITGGMAKGKRGVYIPNHTVSSEDGFETVEKIMTSKGYRK